MSIACSRTTVRQLIEESNVGRPPRFSSADVENAALAVLDRDGAGGLTLRAVARELGTGPMTMYGYVESAAALDALVVDRVLRAATPLPEPSAEWRSDVAAIAEAVWRAVRPHPHVVPLILARRSGSAMFLDIAEALLVALARSGRHDQELLSAFRAVSTLATSFAMTELAGPLSASREDPDAVVERFRALPLERYPRLVEIARAASTSDPVVEFRAGIEALLDGLSSGSSARRGDPA
jgi:AcrR family transcriptional regulator